MTVTQQAQQMQQVQQEEQRSYVNYIVIKKSITSCVIER